MSDTPRTDFNKYDSWKYYDDPYCVDASFAEELERELNEARIVAAEYRDPYSEAVFKQMPLLPWEINTKDQCLNQQQ